MSRALVRRQPLWLSGAALATFSIYRISVILWARSLATAEARSGLLVPWLLDTVVTVLLLIGISAGCCRLMSRARRRDREQARVEHLAEVGLLAGGLAHEIRNTLNAMHSQIGLLRKQLSPAAAAASHRVGQVERAVAELEELVSEFLTFARPARDQLEEVNLANLIGGLLDFVALDLEQARVTAVIKLAQDLPPVYVDPAKLRRALLNLIINARQAMPEGGTLTLSSARGQTGEVVVEVSDTGCGISEEDRPHIFETFFSTRPGGTGLGLAVVKRTVEDFGGRVTFDSELGRGTIFRIFLPSAERRRSDLQNRAKQQVAVV